MSNIITTTLNDNINNNHPFDDLFNFLPHVSKEFILSKISISDIFSRYLHVPNLNTGFINPFREDKNPDCRFYISKGSNGISEIRFKDFAYGYNWSCFDVVMIKYNLNFHKALQKIAIDFDLFDKNRFINETNESLDTTTEIISNEIYQKIKYIPQLIHKVESCIEIKKRRFNHYDMLYWEQYGLAIEDLYYVYPVQVLWLNKKIIYTYRENDPCYAYGLGNGKYKCYFPFRSNRANSEKKIKGNKFLQSGKHTQGTRLLPKIKNEPSNELLFITKSYKDVLVLRKMKYYAIAPSSETSLIDKEEIEKYKRMFKHIILFFDNDMAGKYNSNKHSKIYGIPEIFIPDGYSKDISDFIANEGNGDIDTGIDLIGHLIEQQTNIINNYDTQSIQI